MNREPVRLFRETVGATLSQDIIHTYRARIVVAAIRIHLLTVLTFLVVDTHLVENSPGEKLFFEQTSNTTTTEQTAREHDVYI